MEDQADTSPDPKDTPRVSTSHHGLTLVALSNDETESATTTKLGSASNGEFLNDGVVDSSTMPMKQSKARRGRGPGRYTAGMIIKVRSILCGDASWELEANPPDHGDKIEESYKCKGFVDHLAIIGYTTGEKGPAACAAAQRAKFTDAGMSPASMTWHTNFVTKSEKEALNICKNANKLMAFLNKRKNFEAECKQFQGRTLEPLPADWAMSIGSTTCPDASTCAICVQLKEDEAAQRHPVKSWEYREWAERGCHVGYFRGDPLPDARKVFASLDKDSGDLIFKLGRMNASEECWAERRTGQLDRDDIVAVQDFPDLLSTSEEFRRFFDVLEQKQNLPNGVNEYEQFIDLVSSASIKQIVEHREFLDKAKNAMFPIVPDPRCKGWLQLSREKQILVYSGEGARVYAEVKKVAAHDMDKESRLAKRPDEMVVMDSEDDDVVSLIGEGSVALDPTGAMENVTGGSVGASAGPPDGSGTEQHLASSGAQLGKRKRSSSESDKRPSATRLQSLSLSQQEESL